jgi:primase-like protein
VDLSIKDRVRLFRLPNTIHEKSKLYKVVLSLDEIHRLSPEAIRDCAGSARPLTLTDKTGLISFAHVAPNATASDFLQHISRQLKKFTRKPFSYTFSRQGNIERVEFPCAALEVIWKSHIDPGSRNNCAIRLASELRLLGLSEEEAGIKLLQWNKTNNIGLSADELHNVVRSAYLHGFPYRYSCRDEVLRQFCPLPDYESCRAHVSDHLK